TGVPFAGRGPLPATLQDLARLMPRCAGVRRWAAAALDMAYVAAGRFDGYCERGIHARVNAAGFLLVRDAGRLVAPILEAHEGPLADAPHIIAGNAGLFETFAEIIRQRD